MSGEKLPKKQVTGYIIGMIPLTIILGVLQQKLVKCKKCKYMCKSVWKKCPICQTQL